jgi:hypothetical protein
MRKGYIYAVENNFDDHVYIGSTVDSIENRFRKHKADALKRPSCAFHVYMKLHGIDNFSIKLIKEVDIFSILDLHLLEESFIKDYGSLNTIHGELKNLQIERNTTESKIFSKQTPWFTTIDPQVVKMDDVIKEISNNIKISIKELIEIFIEPEQNFDSILNNITVENTIYISREILTWLGYTGAFGEQRKGFKKLLKRHNLPFEEIKSSDVKCSLYSNIQRDMNILNKGVVSQSKWLIMNIDSFKKIALAVNTKNSVIIKQYFINVETIVSTFIKYC